MSDREKKLVLFFGLAAFFLVNLFGISRFRTYRDSVKKDLVAANKAIDNARDNRDAYDERVDELEWMGEHRPEPKDRQSVESELVEYMVNQATAAKLTPDRPKPKPTIEEGIFHRAQVDLKVSGTEANLYQWLDKLQVPDKFRAITFMRLSPDQKDDTLIDCSVTVEQWFVPQTADAEPESAEAQPEGTGTNE